DRAAVDADQAAARVEVARQELAHLFRVARLRQGREADEIGEEDGDEAALGGLRRRRGRRRGRICGEGAAALAAKVHPGLVRGATRRAAEREGSTAAAAELAPGRILDPAVRARDHALTLTSVSEEVEEVGAGEDAD